MNLDEIPFGWCVLMVCAAVWYFVSCGFTG